jgi:hypothetical protein
MARIIRAEIFNPREIAVLHLCARVCRRCFLLGKAAQGHTTLLIIQPTN